MDLPLESTITRMLSADYDVLFCASIALLVMALISD
jgi:hypothetical protein